MNLEDAFTNEAIAAAGVDEDTDTAELEELIRASFSGAQVTYSPDHVHMGVLCFLAGRTKQLDETKIAVTMTLPLVQEFMEFLARRQS